MKTAYLSAAQVSRRAGSVLAFLVLVPGALTAIGCRQRDVCEEVSGPCLALRVTGPSAPGMYDELRTSLSLDAATPVRTGATTGDITLPLTLRVVPPEGVLPSAVHAVGVSGLLAGSELASAQTPPGFAWADDQHLTITLELAQGQNPDSGMPTDMAGPASDLAGRPADLAGPPADMTLPPAPSLKWVAETNPGGLKALYDVWSGSGTQVLAVGAGGLVLARQATGAWLAETSSTTNTLYSVFGLPGSGVWAVGESPGAWRRDSATGKWQADQQGLALKPSDTVWSVTTGAAAGELWAGGDDGKVWHRLGSPAAGGTWTAEQALPAGITVSSVAYADGAVFAVGQRGYAAVRKDSGAMTRWVAAPQYPALAGMTMGHADGLYGVWAFDRNTAVAVGSKGLLVRCTGGSWQPATQTIDAGGNEFNGVWGTAPGRVWAVGYNGLIVRIDAATTTQLRSDGTQSLYGIFGRSDADIYAVGSGLGDSSLILHGQP